MNKLNEFLRNQRLGVSFVIFTIVFLVTRLPYYLSVNIPYIYDDAGTYTAIMQNILEGKIPTFEIRTPGYPLFLFISFLFSENVVAVMYLQSIFTVLVSFFFIYAVYKCYTKYTYLITFALTIYTSSIINLNYETTILTESVYTNLILLFVPMLIMAFKTNQKVWWALVGIVVMLTVYVRPSSLFLIPILLFVLIYLFIKKYPLSIKIIFTVPIIALYLLLSTYNYFTLNSFTLSPFGGLNLLGTVITFVEPDSSFPDYINKSITDAVQVPEEDKQLLKNSDNNLQKTAIYLEHYHTLSVLSGHISKNGNHKSYMSALKDIKLVSYSAIKTHPNQYFDFVYTMMINYFQTLHPEKNVTYPFLNKDYNYLVDGRVRRYFEDNANKSGYYLINKAPTFTSSEANKIIENINNNFWHKLNNSISNIYNYLFRSMFWVYLSFLTLIIGLYVFIKSKLANIEAFIIILIVLMNIGHALLVSLVEISILRYSCTLFFTYFIAPALLPLIIDFSFLKRLIKSKNANVPVSKQSVHSNIKTKKSKKTVKK